MVVPFDYDTEPKERVPTCNLCGAVSPEPERIRDRYGLSVGLSRCACGLMYLNPRMTAEAYGEFYAKGHYRRLLSQFYGRKIDASSIERDQRRYAVKAMAVLGPHMNGSHGKLLDVGGSTGVVSDAFRNVYDLNATVLEPSEAEADAAEARGLSVLRCSLEDVPVSGDNTPLIGTFDVILMCQTIDHLHDIAGSLEKIQGMLKPKGVFFVDFVSGGPIKIDHPYYLNWRTGRQFMKQAGFEVVSASPDADGLHVNMVCR